MIESIDNGRIATLATTEGVPQDIDLNDAGPDLLSMVIEEVATNRDIVPMTLEQELSPHAVDFAGAGRRAAGMIAPAPLATPPLPAASNLRGRLMCGKISRFAHAH